MFNINVGDVVEIVVTEVENDDQLHWITNAFFAETGAILTNKQMNFINKEYKQNIDSAIRAYQGDVYIHGKKFASKQEYRV